MARNLDIKSSVARLNEITKNIKNLSDKQVYELFKENKVQYYSSLIPYFKKSGYLSKSDNNLYTWTKTEPVYYKEIVGVIAITKTKYQEKKHIELTEEYAITFLKGKGYKIMKPIVEYTEI